MFSLVAGFWRWLKHKTEVRFLILGLDNAGKTTTLEQIKRIYSSRTPKLELERVTPTIGLNLCHVEFDRSTSGVFCDLGGQLMLRGIWEKHYDECDGLIFVVDSTDGDRLDEVGSMLEKVVNHPALQKREIPILILINKQDDVVHALPFHSVIQHLGCHLDDQVVRICYPSLNPTDPTNETTGGINSAGINSGGANPTTVGAKETRALRSKLISHGTSGPSLVCIAACSAMKNVNIQLAINCLVREALRNEEGSRLS